MQPLIWDHRPAGLRAPAMICAFQGWNDAGDAASTAVAFMGTKLGAQRFAQVDTEEFYDFQANRPRIKLAEEESKREIEWPSVEMFEAVVPRAPRDLVLVQGVEPSMRWKSFGALVVELAEALGVQMVITLGALLADVAHTRPVSMTGFASDPALAERMGTHNTSNYEGPTGIVGVLHSMCAEAGLPSMSLWASIPHYVAAAPSPKAALAIVRRLEGLVGVSVDATDLETAASARWDWPSPATPTCRRLWKSSSATPRTSRNRSAPRIYPRATCWLATSSAFCASAAPTDRPSHRLSQGVAARPEGADAERSERLEVLGLGPGVQAPTTLLLEALRHDLWHRARHTRLRPKLTLAHLQRLEHGGASLS
jgi:proteasome assembly chaperone (PAC2) family protein